MSKYAHIYIKLTSAPMKTCDKYQQACFKLHIKTIEHIRKQQNVCIECDLFFEHELFESNVL